MRRNQYVSKTNGKIQEIGMFQKERLSREADPPQNMMLKQVRFPSEIRKNEHFADIWVENLTTQQWTRALLKIISNAETPQTWFWEATEDSFIAMAQSLVGKKFRVTGAMVVRYSDDVGHKPKFRVLAVGMKFPRRTYGWNEGPHILRNLMPVDASPPLSIYH